MTAGAFVVRDKPFFGKAVVDGHLRYTSVSSLTSFDPESYGGCNRKWWWVKVAGKEEPETEAQRLGVEKHGELQHWFEMGEDVLSPIVRAGKHLLPLRGPDILVEQAFGTHIERDFIQGKLPTEQDPLVREAMVRRLLYVEAQLARYGEMRLVAGDVDLVGFIDLRHRRGQFVDVDGTVRPEAPELGRVAEVIDHKTSASVVEYGKTGPELLDTIQMIEYGVLVADTQPDINTVRFSHITYQTRGAHYARKSTAFLSVAEVRERARRIAGVAKDMRDVARMTRVEDVEPNFDSCTSFGRKGCPHREYCPVDHRAIVYGQLNILPPAAGAPLSMFERLGVKTADLVSSNGTVPPPMDGVIPAAPVPVVSALEYEAAVAAEKARLLAEVTPAVPPLVTYGPCQQCRVPLTPANAFLGEGLITHVGCLAGVPVAPKAPDIGAVNPPDASQPTLFDAADPLTPEQITEITNPALLVIVEEHARDHAVHAVTEATEKAAAEKEKGDAVWCPGSYQRIAVDVAMMLKKKKLKCAHCSKENSLRPAEQPDGTYQATVPRHKPVAPPVPETGAVPSAPAAPVAPPAPATVASAMSVSVVTAPPAPVSVVTAPPAPPPPPAPAPVVTAPSAPPTPAPPPAPVVVATTLLREVDRGSIQKALKFLQAADATLEADLAIASMLVTRAIAELGGASR